MNITSGIIPSAQKLVLYGPEGIGKSTFAAQFPDVLFSDTEGSTKKLDVKRFEAPTSWQMLLEQAAYVRDKKPCATYAIDTLDWAEKLCMLHVCAKAKKKSIEEFGYGKGYTYLMEEFSKLLNLLTEIVDAGIHVVLLAHAKMRKFEQPDEMGAYDRWELKLTRQVGPLISEWADTLLFANYKTYVVAADDNGKVHKAQGGTRMMYTTHHPCWDAKNRDNLPDEIPLDFEQIRHILTDASPQVGSAVTPLAVQQINAMIDHDDFEEIVTEKPAEEKSPEPSVGQAKNAEKLQSKDPVIQSLYDLMNENDVSPADLQAVVADKGYYPRETEIENYDPTFITGVLVHAWDQVFNTIKDYQKIPF